MELNELNKNAMGGTELMQRRLHSTLPAELLNKFQIICSRPRELHSDKKRILWCHDLPGDPEVRHLADPKQRANYSQIVFVSNWQMQQYKEHLGVPFSGSVVLCNAIERFSENVIQEKSYDTIKIIYTPTPHRGLELLVPVFEKIMEQEKYKDAPIQLDVYSSFNLYGWPERDQPYKALFERCKVHPKIKYHGAQSNEVVRNALKEAHIFAYPSIWQETSCLCLMEAMSAGLICVHPNFAALPETAGGLTWMYQWDEDLNIHANKFGRVLMSAIDICMQEKEKIIPTLTLQKVVCDARFDWSNRSLEWKTLLSQLTS